MIKMYNIMKTMCISGDPVAKKTPKIIARAGQQLQMTCPISGYPIFNINWEKGMKKKNKIWTTIFLQICCR